MWEMLERVFSMIGRGGHVGDLFMEEIEIEQEVKVQALKHNLKDPEVLEAFIKKSKKALLKGADANSEEFDPFAILRTEKEGTK